MMQSFPNDATQVRQQLSHVLWLGGGTDAGKSSVVKALGEKYHFRWYNFDYFEPDHFRRMNHEVHPATFAFLAMPIDERWIQRSAAAMAQSTIAMWRERFQLAIEDLLAWPSDGVIVAEGPGLFPECVDPYIGSPDQALWLAPTRAFKEKIHPTRENKIAVAAATSNPALAQRKMIDRDLLMGEYIQEQARVRSLTVLDVDGTRSLAEMAAEVEQHFGPLLAQAPRR